MFHGLYKIPRSKISSKISQDHNRKVKTKWKQILIIIQIEDNNAGPINSCNKKNLKYTTQKSWSSRLWCLFFFLPGQEPVPGEQVRVSPLSPEHAVPPSIGWAFTVKVSVQVASQVLQVSSQATAKKIIIVTKQNENKY